MIVRIPGSSHAQLDAFCQFLWVCQSTVFGWQVGVDRGCLLFAQTAHHDCPSGSRVGAEGFVGFSDAWGLEDPGSTQIVEQFIRVASE